jgi:hypothetical protein
MRGWRSPSQSRAAYKASASTVSSPNSWPSEVLPVSGSSPRAVPSLESGAITRAAIIASASCCSAEDREARRAGRSSRRMVPTTAATCPWGQLRSMVRCSEAGTMVSPRRIRRTASTASVGRLERLARVRLQVLLPSRQDSRRRMAGGELRLRTVSIYMAA